MFLTRAELEELTDYKLAYWQCVWLEKNGYSFQIGASGRPKVLRSHVEQKLGVMQNASTRSAQPNFDAIQ
jgi:hypothetical protein